jgi:hypothetical protein
VIGDICRSLVQVGRVTVRTLLEVFECTISGIIHMEIGLAYEETGVFSVFL